MGLMFERPGAPAPAPATFLAPAPVAAPVGTPGSFTNFGTAPAPAFGGGRGIPPELFSGMQQAKIGKGGGPYVEPGETILRIDGFKYDNNRLGPCFIFDLTFMHVLVDSDGRTNRAGTTASYLIKCEQQYGFYKSDLKQFVLTYFGEPETSETKYTDQEWLETFGEMAGQPSPIVGKLMHLKAWHKPKKSKPDEMITKLKWLRRVSYEELAQVMDPTLRRQLVPDSVLSDYIAKEKQEAAALRG